MRCIFLFFCLLPFYTMLISIKRVNCNRETVSPKPVSVKIIRCCGLIRILLLYTVEWIISSVISCILLIWHFLLLNCLSSEVFEPRNASKQSGRSTIKQRKALTRKGQNGYISPSTTVLIYYLRVTSDVIVGFPTSYNIVSSSSITQKAIILKYYEIQ